MRVGLEDGTTLRGDFVLRAVQRFDLTPIPSTLELTLRADDTLGGRVADGSVLIAGSTNDRYRVVKLRRAPSDQLQGKQDKPVDVIEVTALLDGFVALARPLQRAVVKESKSLGEVFRSCGATARVAEDIPAGRFVCMAGMFPTPGIAQLLQEEAAAAVWRSTGRLSFIRLPDLFTQTPVEKMQADTARAVQSTFLEQHQIPWAMSTSADGSALLGNRETARGFVYLPRTSQRVLNNMTRCLVVRRATSAGFAGHIRAGDVVELAGSKHVVVTAAHRIENGADRGTGGGGEQTTSLWLAQLQR